MNTGNVGGAMPPSRSTVGWNLLLVLILTLPPLLIEVHRPAPTRIMETLSFLSSQETWLRLYRGEPDAWKSPTWNGRPRIQKPPLLVWMNLIAWKGLTPPDARVEDLVARSRWLAAALALVAVLSVYGIGFKLGGSNLAMAGALATGLASGFVRQARYASYDTHLMAWVALSVLGAVWACRLPKTAMWARALGWGLAALFLTATNYTKGPLGFVLVWPAWMAAVAWLSEDRRRDTWAMAAAVVFAALALAAWFLAARVLTPRAGQLLQEEYAYIFEISKNPLFYVILLGLMFPWTFWFAAGAAWPVWRAKSREPRVGAFIWTWVVAVFVLLSLAPVKNKRYLAPLFPAAGLLAAYAWLELHRLAAEGRAGVRRLTAMHWGALTLGTALLPTFAALEPWALAHGLLRRATFGSDGWVLWAIAPCALVPLLLAGFWVQRQGRVMAAILLTGAWFSAAATFGFYAYARTPRQQYPFRADAERLTEMARQAPLFYISRFQPPDHEAMPGHELLIYYRGIIPATTMDELIERAAKGDPLMVLTRLTDEDELRLQRAGFRELGEINDGRRPPWKLFAIERPK